MLLSSVSKKSLSFLSLNLPPLRLLLRPHCYSHAPRPWPRHKQTKSRRKSFQSLFPNVFPSHTTQMHRLQERFCYIHNETDALHNQQEILYSLYMSFIAPFEWLRSQWNVQKKTIHLRVDASHLSTRSISRTWVLD